MTDHGDAAGTDSPGGVAPPMDLRAVQAWTRHQNTPPRIVLVCAEHPNPAVPDRETDAVIVLDGCLTHLPRASPVQLLVDGARSVRLCLDGCADAATVAERFAGIAALFAAPASRVIGADDARFGLVHVTGEGSSEAPVLRSGSMPLPRRLLLGAEASAPTATGTTSDHADLIVAVEALGPDPAVAAAAPGPGLLLRARGCVACGVCVRTCPEGALTLRQENGASLLEQRVASCAGHGDCLDACRENALDVRRSARWAEQLGDRTLPLAVVETRACARCGAESPDDGSELCRVCTYRRENPFGSHLPPAAAALLDRATGRQN